MKLLLAFVAIILILSVLGLISIQDLLVDAINSFFSFLKSLMEMI